MNRIHVPAAPALPRAVRACAAAVAAGLVALAFTGCAGEQQAFVLDAVTAPSWFTAPRDQADPDVDPPRWNRSYAGLPRSQSDVELAYAQALDRAGWHYRAGECAQAPRGGRIKADCWVHEGYVLAYTTRPEGARDGDRGPTRLEIVLHEAARTTAQTRRPPANALR
jgi:hypothetical protein